MLGSPSAQYVFSPLAREDLLKISLKGIEEWGTAQAAKYVSQIDSCLVMIAENPSIGSKRDEVFSGAYSFPVGKHIIVYRHNNDSGIEISRILHQRMDINLYFG